MSTVTVALKVSYYVFFRANANPSSIIVIIIRWWNWKRRTTVIASHSDHPITKKNSYYYNPKINLQSLYYHQRYIVLLLLPLKININGNCNYYYYYYSQMGSKDSHPPSSAPRLPSYHSQGIYLLLLYSSLPPIYMFPPLLNFILLLIDRILHLHLLINCMYILVHK